MMRELVNYRGGKVYRPVVTEDELRTQLFGLDNLGFCLDCGCETDGVEPDARKYHCDECGMMAVYGLEELVMMDLVRIGEVTDRWGT